LLKKFAVSLLTLAFLTLGAGSAFGATTPDPAKLQELKALHQQMYELRVKMIDKKVEAGLIDEGKATKIKESMESHKKKVEEDMAKGKFDSGKKHGKDCGKKFKGNLEPAPVK
jgi:hypothetical protein